MIRSSLSCSQSLVLALLIGGGTLLPVQSARAQLPSGTNWALTFADNFSGTSLDAMKWSVGEPWDPGATTAGNISVGNGVLDLSSVRTSSVSSSASFTNAYIATENSSYNELFGTTYGYVEASMQLPSLLGSWPAFWMLASGWPPEIDIMEGPAFVNGTYSVYNYSDNIHYVSSGSDATLGDGVHYAGAGDLTQTFNTYAMAWTPTSVSFYINGVAQPSSPITNATALSNGSGDLLGNGAMYLLLDNVGGGSWPGVPSVSQWPVGTASTLQVQWVRVWKNGVPSGSGSASSTSWNNTTGNSGSWTSAGEWTSGVPQLSSQTAVFGANAVNNQTVNWNYSQTVGGLTFDSSTSYTIGSAAGSLMLANTAYNSSGDGSGGAVLIDATSAFGSGANYLDCRLELYDNTTMQTSSKPLIVNGSLIGTGNLTIAAGPVTLAGSSTTTGQITVSAAAGRAAVLNFVPGSLIDANYPSAPSLSVATVAGGTATINMTGGTLATASEFWLSSANGASGIMNMSGGVAVVGSWLAVGRGGNGGVLNVSGGSLIVAANNLTLASFAGNSGTLNVSGGTVDAVNAVYDGESGTGAMTLSRSGVVTAGGLFIGLNGGASGVYTQTGGLLAANGTTYNASSGTGITVGSAAGSSGTLNISGGTINGAAPIMVWGGTGSITVSQTGATPTVINAGWITLGQVSGAVGSLTQNGGAITLPNDFYVGWGSGTTGKYIMHGGSMTVGDIRTDSGTGTIYQDGGTVTSEYPYWIRLGIGASAISSYTLAGGTLIANDGEVNVGENGSGALTIGGSHGGTMLVSPSTGLTVANGSGSGTLNLQAGGLLRTPSIAAGAGAAAFNFSGGTLQNALSGGLSVTMPVNLIGGGTVDIDRGKTGTFNAQAPIGGDGSLCLTGGGTLVLGGSNTYSGGTTVLGGELIVTALYGLEEGSNLSVGDDLASFAAVWPAALLGTVPSSGTPIDTSGAAVPEPGTLALLTADAAAAVLAVRRRKTTSSRRESERRDLQGGNAEYRRRNPFRSGETSPFRSKSPLNGCLNSVAEGDKLYDESVWNLVPRRPRSWSTLRLSSSQLLATLRKYMNSGV
jgi:autotransporter-associated beta strand protein